MVPGSNSAPSGFLFSACSQASREGGSDVIASSIEYHYAGLQWISPSYIRIRLKALFRSESENNLRRCLDGIRDSYRDHKYPRDGAQVYFSSFLLSNA